MLLILSNDKNEAELLSEIFFRMGVFTATSCSDNIPNESFRAILICRGFDKSIVEKNFPDAVLVQKSTQNASLILSEINSKLKSMGRAELGEYNIKSLLVDEKINNFDRLTKTERRIISLLFCTYPKKRSAEDILSLAYLTANRPENGAVRTHICAINKKIGKKIIVNDGSGYFLKLEGKIQ